MAAMSCLRRFSALSRCHQPTPHRYQSFPKYRTKAKRCAASLHVRASGSGSKPEQLNHDDTAWGREDDGRSTAPTVSQERVGDFTVLQGSRGDATTVVTPTHPHRLVAALLVERGQEEDQKRQKEALEPRSAAPEPETPPVKVPRRGPWQAAELLDEHLQSTGSEAPNPQSLADFFHDEAGGADASLGPTQFQAAARSFPTQIVESPTTLFAHLQRLFREGEPRPAGWTQDRWKGIFLTLSRSATPEICRFRITTAMKWKMECRSPIVASDVISLATFTADERLSAEDAEMFLDDVKEQLDINPNSQIHVQIIFGLVKHVSGEEAGRFVHKSLFHPERKNLWTPGHFRRVCNSLAAQWDREYRRLKSATREKGTAELELMESNMEETLRIIMNLFKDTCGSHATTDLYNEITKIVRHSIRTLDDALLFVRRMSAEGFKANTMTYNLLAGHLIDNRAQSSVSELIKAMIAANVPADVFTVGATIKSLAVDGRTNQAWGIWSALSKKDSAMLLDDVQFCDVFLSALLRIREDFARALTLTDLMCDRKCVPNANVSGLILDRFLVSSEHKALEAALQYYERVKAALTSDPVILERLSLNAEHPLNSYVHNRLIGECVKRNNIRDALRLYTSMQALCVRPDVVTLTPLIQHCGKLKMGTTVAALLSDLERLGIQPDTVLYTAIIGTLVEDKRFDAASQILKKMKREAISANGQTYNVLIRGLVSAGNFQVAKKMRDQMDVPDLHRQKTIANNIILSGLVKSNETEAVKAFWKDMQASNLTDRVSYHTAIPFFGAQGDLDTVRELFEYLSTSKVPNLRPNAWTYNVMIKTYLDAGLVEDAMDIFSRMPRPDGVSFKIVINYHADTHDFATAERLLYEALRTLPLSDLEMGLERHLIANLGRVSGKLHVVNRIFAAVRASGARSDPYTYAAVLRAHALRGAFTQALALITEMAQEGPRIHTHFAFMNAVIDVYGAMGDIPGMERVVIEMAQGRWLSTNAEPAQEPTKDVLTALTTPPGDDTPRLVANQSTLNILISAYGYSEQLSQAMRLYNYMREHTLPLMNEHDFRLETNEAPRDIREKFGFGHVTVSALLDALGVAREPEQLEEHWRSLREVDKFPMDTNNWTSYLEAKMRCGRVEETLKILLDPPPEFVPELKTLENVFGLCQMAADWFLERGLPAGEPFMRTKARPAVVTALEARVWDVICKIYPQHMEQIQARSRASKQKMAALEDRRATGKSKSTNERLVSSSAGVRSVSQPPAERVLPTKSALPPSLSGGPLMLKGPLLDLGDLTPPVFSQEQRRWADKQRMGNKSGQREHQGGWPYKR